MIIFVGDKPSKKNKDPKVAFVGTHSHKVLENWIIKMGVIGPVRFINRVDSSFETVITDAVLNGWAVITVGKEAEKAILRFTQSPDTVISEYTFYSLPHPSGRNRLLNNKEYIDFILKGCHTFLDRFGYVRNMDV